MIREAVLAEMQDRKLNGAQLAELAGLTKQRVYAWLRGQHKMNDEGLEHICKVLDLQLVKLPRTTKR